MAEIVTFGEAMVRLSPPNFRRLEQAGSLDIFVGGAELNTAVALARFGHASAWVSRLTNNPLGRLIANHAREAGVATEHVVWTDEDRVGVYFLEFGAAPRASSVLYDRKDAAISRIKPGMIDWPKVFAPSSPLTPKAGERGENTPLSPSGGRGIGGEGAEGSKWFHVTGITPALSQSAAESTREALQTARAAGLRISIDLNYRAKLWSQQEAYKWMHEFMGLCDVLITTEEDTAKVLQIKGDNYEDVARRLAETYPLQVVAITLRENPLVWKNSWTAIAYRAGTLFRTRSYEVEIVDRLGAGDSFAAGLIHGLLQNDVQKGLDYGVAASALKHSIPGDFAWVMLEEVEAMLKGGGLRISR